MQYFQIMHVAYPDHPNDGQKVNIVNSVGFEIWMMDDESEEAKRCLKVNYPDWYSLEDRLNEFNSYCVAYGLA